MSHPIVHVEFATRDRKQSAQFYANVFGWKVDDIPEMNYATFETEKGGVGGGFNPVNQDFPVGSTMVYIGTDDLAATLKKIEANGGKTLVPSQEVPGMGWMAIFLDPSGTKVSLWKPADMNQP